MLNNYGNYVVQKALKLSSKNDKIALINNIFKNIEKIKEKKLYAKWKSIIESNLEGTFEIFDERVIEKKSKSTKVDKNKIRASIFEKKEKVRDRNPNKTYSLKQPYS